MNNLPDGMPPTKRGTQHNSTLLRIKPKAPRAVRARLIEPHEEKGTLIALEDHAALNADYESSTRVPRARKIMHAANGKPELNEAIWTRCESGQTEGEPILPKCG